MIFGNIESNYIYFTEKIGLYLPELKEKKIDSEYFKGLYDDKYTTIKKSDITLTKKILN